MRTATTPNGGALMPADQSNIAGDPTDSSADPRLLGPALAIDETESPEDDETETLRFEIASYPADYTVRGLVDKWRRDELVLPEFQRGYIWNLPKASKLVESFLIGLPVPQIFLYKDRKSGKLKVIDGHQRLVSLARFYSGYFSDKRPFRLQGVHSRWQGKTYADLDEPDRLQLDDSPLRSIVVQQLSPDDQESIYLIFERLNAGGVNLLPMEIRKSVFHGQAFDLLDKLNNLDDWRSLIGQAEPDDRLRDVELVLRVLALAAGWRNYTKPMKTFITKYMELLADAQPDELEDIREAFEQAVRTAHEALGDRPFHLRGRLNVAALDSVLGVLMDEDSVGEDDLKRCFEALNRQGTIWTGNVFVSTSDAHVLRARFQAVSDCLAG